MVDTATEDQAVTISTFQNWLEQEHQTMTWLKYDTDRPGPHVSTVVFGLHTCMYKLNNFPSPKSAIADTANTFVSDLLAKYVEIFGLDHNK